MGLLTDRNKNIEGFLDMCQSCVIGSQFLEEQTSQVPLPYYNPQVFKLDLDDDTSFAMNWLADELKRWGNCFLGWPHILDSTDELRKLLGDLFREMCEYVHSYFNYNAMKWIRTDIALPSAGRIAAILLDELCGRIARAYNDSLLKEPLDVCSREDCPAPMMNRNEYVSGDYFKEILEVHSDYGIEEDLSSYRSWFHHEGGEVLIRFDIRLRPDARLGTLDPIHLVVMTLKYPVEYHGNPNE